MNSRLACFMLMAGIAALIPFSALANTIEGAVYSDEAKPIAGALLTLSSADGLYAKSVYSDAKGQFRLISEGIDGTLLRTRKPNFTDSIISVDPTTGDSLKITLHSLKSPLEISNNLTASAHFTMVKFDNPVEEGFFRIECLTCHQLGNSYTRMPRSKDRWIQIVDRMLDFYGVKDEVRTERYAGILFEAFDGSPVTIEQEQQVDPAIFSAPL